MRYDSDKKFFDSNIEEIEISDDDDRD